MVNANQKLNMNIIDMQLEELNKTDCADLLYFNDKLRSITLCGQRNNGSYSMHTNSLLIELRSHSWGRSKGFWLYYEGMRSEGSMATFDVSYEWEHNEVK